MITLHVRAASRLAVGLVIALLARADLGAAAGQTPDAGQPPKTSNNVGETNAAPAKTDAKLPAITEELRWLNAEKVTITSVSKHEEDAFQTAAAVSVITGDDIRRSGARNIPEALRMAPGMDVAQIDANKWAVTARGFNSRFADKLLVLVDGRSVYTPSFSGVFWDTLDYLLEDIERIEVIRGPGGTIWGDNAVNGVINIITKNAKDTEGVFASGGYGTENRGFGDFRFGAKAGENGFVRGYFTYHNTDNLENGLDSWNFWQGGGRADWTLGATKISLHADAYGGQEHQQQVTAQLPAVPFTGPVITTVNESYRVNGQNVVARMEHEFSEDNSLQLQAYFDRAERRELLTDGYRNTFDVDYQHRFALPGRQNFTYGFGYRYLPDHFRNPDPNWIDWSPADRHWQLFSGFLQDEIELIEDRLRFTLGSKVEHNDVTGFEAQPSGRLAFTPNQQQTIWGAVSRAVQVPGRNVDGIQSIVIPTQAALPLTVVGHGNQEIKATEMIAYELGHRWQPVENFSVDVALFYQHYRELVDGQITIDVGNGTLNNNAINQGTADSYGFEISSKWRVIDAWQLTLAYSHLNVDFHDSTVSLFGEGRDPQNQLSLRSSFDLPGGFELDLWGRYVDQLGSLGVHPYFDADVRLGWHLTRNIEFSITGQNLISPSRIEFGADQFTVTPVSAVQRTVYAQVSLRF